MLRQLMDEARRECRDPFDAYDERLDMLGIFESYSCPPELGSLACPPL